LEFEKSKTYQNVMNTYKGELSASTKYRIYAGKAREDGYEQIGNIFDETAHNEKEHAEMMLELMNEVPSTKQNLEESIAGETAEFQDLYKQYAETARQEGFDQIGALFDQIAAIEKNHQRQYKILLENIDNNEVFCKPEAHWWLCLNCGHLYYGKCAPTICPVCAYPQGFYELYCENF